MSGVTGSEVRRRRKVARSCLRSYTRRRQTRRETRGRGSQSEFEARSQGSLKALGPCNLERNTEQRGELVELVGLHNEDHWSLE